MQRRDFFAFIGGAAVGWPIFAYAQQPKTPVVGFLNAGSPDGYAPYVKGFLHGLGETGFVEGKNVSVDYRWAREEYNRLQAMAADLVRRRVAVIAANTPAARSKGGDHRDSDCLCQHRRSSHGRHRRELQSTRGQCDGRGSSRLEFGDQAPRGSA